MRVKRFIDWQSVKGEQGGKDMAHDGISGRKEGVGEREGGAWEGWGCQIRRDKWVLEKAGGDSGHT